MVMGLEIYDCPLFRLTSTSIDLPADKEEDSIKKNIYDIFMKSLLVQVFKLYPEIFWKFVLYL